MSDYRKVFEDGRAKGFDVTHARQYYNNGDEKLANVETFMKTPYQFSGRDVTGYAVVPLYDGREANTIEFYIGDRNLEDLTGGFSYVLYNKETESLVNCHDAAEEMGQFASAASEYPHVFTYDEYCAAREPINKRMHLDPPDEEAYMTYINNVERQLMSRDIKFVGQIQSRDQIHDAYMTMPSVQEEMDEVYGDMDFGE